MTTDLDPDLDIEARLRAAFSHRAERAIARAAESPIATTPSNTGRSWPALLAVAAASAVLVGGLVAVQARDTDNSPAPATQPSSAPPASPSTVVPIDPSDVAAVDVMEIDLDAWQPLPEVATGLTFLVIDVDRLPAGSTLVDQEGSTFLGGPVDQPSYAASARIETAEGDDVFAAVEAYQFAPCPNEGEPATGSKGPIDIDGVDATIVLDALCWEVAPAVFASVRFGGVDLMVDAAVVDRLAEVARELRLVEVDRLPRGARVDDAADPTGTAPDDPELGGLLGGLEWSATVSDTTLRTMQIYVDGHASSGFENDRASQPTDSPAGSGEVSIGGTPGAGAMVFGYVMPEAAGLIVRSDSDAAIRLPLVRGELESYFALPIPEGVVIESAVFVGDDGVPIASLEFPVLPRDLSGTYGGFGRIRPL